MGVEDGNGLSEVVSLGRGERKDGGPSGDWGHCSPLTPREVAGPVQLQPPKVSTAGRPRESGDLVPILGSVADLCVTLGRSL